MLEEFRHLAHDRFRLAGNDDLDVARQCREQRGFVDEAGEHEQNDDQQRQDREQGVERHRARKQEALVRTKPAKHAKRKGAGPLQEPCEGIGDRLRHGGDVDPRFLPRHVVALQVSRI